MKHEDRKLAESETSTQAFQALPEDFWIRHPVILRPLILSTYLWGPYLIPKP